MTISAPDRELRATIHLLALDDQSLRVVALADGGAVIGDLLLTSEGGQLPAAEAASPLADLAPALRHGLLRVAEKPGAWRQGVLMVESMDGSRRSYGGDPVALRQVEGHWGWVHLADFRMLAGGLLPHSISGAMGPVSWRLDLTRVEPVLDAVPEASAQRESNRGIPAS